MNRRQILAAAAMLAASPVVPAIAGDAPAVPIKVRVRRTGWAGIQVERGDKALFVDPEVIFYKRPELGIKSVALDTQAGSRYVALTHLHGDHFDPDAIKSILKSPGDLVICHEKMAASIAAQQFPVAGVAMYEPYSAGNYEEDDIALAAVPAQDGYGDLQVSWVIVAGGVRMIHCGDTIWHGDWLKIGRIYGPFDLAFLPINGFRQSTEIYPVSTVAKSMGPEEAAQAALLLRAKAAVPIHYGRKPRPSYLETENALNLFVAAAGRAGVKPLVSEPGAWIDL